ncbi:Uncharacterized protein PCOAH_00016760 [Plasmodium coatneyi]|uniref:Uncharacterized protein n=1 Tax=Plasmodium coatneyi TaxID=208452 RepID=A0A1B1DX64_9APIC|nr:Uncharacterized protein PCOAH_00016760 [Plasmodium coatneyi]ANQ07373.1 Uncharacterized protein PCOAH_00016760 [Plasmodium coatneyi]
MGTSDLNFYINKHRKAYEERLKREQQNLQGKTSEGGVEKVARSEVAKGDATEQSNETDNRNKNLKEGDSQNASQSDATRNSTRDENINQVDADYLFALKLNEALNGHAEPTSVANEKNLSSVERNEDADPNECGGDDVRKPDNSYVECLLGDNNYMPFCVNYNVGRGDSTNQNSLSPSGRNRRSGHHVDHEGGGHMYGPYNLRSRNNRMNGFQSSNNRDRRYSPRLNSPHEPINISLSSDDEEEVQVNNEIAKSYFSKDDGVRRSSEVFYVPEENLSLTPRQSKPSGQSNLGRPFSTRWEDSKGEVTTVEGGKPNLCIQACGGKGGENIPRMMERGNNFSFQSVDAQGGENSPTGRYSDSGVGSEAPKCTVEKSIHGLCDVYNDHFGFTNRGTYRFVRSAAAEVGHPLGEGGNPNGNNPVRSNYVDSSAREDYSQEGRYYVHYEPMNPSGTEKEKNKPMFEGAYDVDSYGDDGVDNGSRFLPRGKYRNGGGGGRAKNAEGEYYKEYVHDGSDVIPLEGEDLIGGDTPSPYKGRAKKSRRKVKDLTQVERIHNDEGFSPQIVQLDGAPKMTYTLRSSGKKPTNEKIEDPYCCKGEGHEVQNGRGVEGGPEDDPFIFRTDLGRRNDPNMGVCNSGGYPKRSGVTYADMGRDIMQSESSPFNMLHFEKGNPVEQSVNDYSVNNVLMQMDDNARVLAEMASKCAPLEKGSRLPFESLHRGAIEQEGSPHSRTNEPPELFTGRDFTLNHCQDGISLNTFNRPEGGLRNYVEEGKWCGAPLDRSSALRGAHFTGEVPSSSRMVEEPLCGEAAPHSEFLLVNEYGASNYKVVPINGGGNLQGSPEEKRKKEGHYRYVNNDRTLNRFNGKSPLGGPTPDVYVIDEGTTFGEPHSTYEQNVQQHHMGGYLPAGIFNQNAQQVGYRKRENAGSVKAEGTQMEQEQVQEGSVVNSLQGDAYANRDVSDQSYGRGMDDNTTSAMDQCDQESGNSEDLNVQQAIINSLIDF